MSLHKLTAGTGYTYLTRQVAAHDRTRGPRTSLASYYTEKGETPGRWVGSGVAGIDGLSVGDEVTAQQMRALFGCRAPPAGGAAPGAARGARPDRPGLQGGDPAGGAVQGVRGRGDRVPGRGRHADRGPRRVPGAPAGLPGRRRRTGRGSAPRSRPRSSARSTAGTRATPGSCPATIAKLSRPKTTAVAGYDLTFSPVKSVSTLWAIAPPEVAAQVELAHHEAVADALAFIEKHALYTREGANGVRQVDVTGLVAAAFTHRDSRAGDPDLHTHVAVANKVQTLSGKWLSIDGRILFKAKVTASETYNTALEKHLRTRLGLVFAERAGTERGKRPVREVVGVDPALNRRWSTRRASIEARRGELATAFQGDHGRPPTVVEAILLAQQATLETRDAKHEPRTLAEQRAAWREQAEDVLGGPRRGVVMVATALSARRAAPADTVDAAWVRDTATRVRDEIQARRSTWQVWHVRAEAHRQVRAANLPAEHVDTVVDLVTDQTLDRRLDPAHPGRRRHRGAGRAAPRRRVQRVRGRRLRGLHQHRRSWPPSSASSTPPASPTGTAPALTRSRWRCSSRPPTGPPSTPDRPRWSPRWPPPAPGSSWRSPPPGPGRPPPCAP